ncbi:MAG: TSUP family transporter, partial [Acetobacteraceae bacterium]|nr:TSUP family transporter [Acetobacteraceae bacterium]
AGAALGVALLAYAALGLTGWRPRLAARWGGAVGGATGLVTAATGVFILPAVPWLQSQGLGKDALVRAMGLAFTVSTLALGVGLAGAGQLPGVALGASALALIPALLGLRLGAWLRGRLSEAAFRQALFLGLGALGLHALWRALG